MPESLYEAINKIRVDAILDGEREKLSTFSGRIAALLQELPRCHLTREEMGVLVEQYEIRKQAQDIVDQLLPQKI